MVVIPVRYVFSILILLLAVDAQVCESATTLEELSSQVAYLQEGNSSATGFFVSASGRFFLVTAEHVANILTVNSTITVRNPGDIPTNLMFKDLVQGATTLPWIRHSEGDVAVLPINVSGSNEALMNGRFFPAQLLVSQELAPPRERPVVVMGFPLKLGTKVRFSPITSEANPASGLLRLPRLDTKKEATFFVLDKPSIGGFSGAPVFLMPGPFFTSGTFKIPGKDASPVCVGLVHGTLSDNTGGKLGVVVPSSVIVATIKAAGGDNQTK